MSTSASELAQPGERLLLLSAMDADLQQALHFDLDPADPYFGSGLFGFEMVSRTTCFLTTASRAFDHELVRAPSSIRIVFFVFRKTHF